MSKEGELRGNLKAKAHGNPEPSRRMKQAAGRCDGQRVPRIEMSRISALHESDDMTCSPWKLGEVQSRRCTITFCDYGPEEMHGTITNLATS